VVGTINIQNSAITEALINNLAVSTDKIQNGAVTNLKIGNAAVDTAQIAALAVETAQIDNLAVTEGKIADLAVTAAKIANATITSAKINDLSADKITAGTITGSTLQTASSGKRFVVSTSDNEAHFYGDRGDGTITELVSIGIDAGSDQEIIRIFSPAGTQKRHGLVIDPHTYGAPMRIVPATSTPGGNGCGDQANIGSLWVDQNCVLWIKIASGSGSDKWAKVGTQT
jgi:hypothetical protein